MKHSMSEVSTIFHPKKNRIPASSDEYSVNQPLDSLQKMIDNTDNQRSCGHDTDYNNSSNGCRTSEAVNRYSSGNVANINADNSSERTTYHCPTQNLQLSQARHSNRSCLHQGSYTSIFRSCCAVAAKKIYYGICVTIFVTASWVGATHFIKFIYFQNKGHAFINMNISHNYSFATENRMKQQLVHYNAPFFITWFSTNWTILYFPIYFIGQSVRMKCSSPSELFAESLKGFRDKGLTGGRFLIRCGLFCGLWVATNYMYIHSLRILLATDVMTLYATNVACVYLLSWVILHEQFVGVRIVAVILCDTGIALLAYMDGITGSPTLMGVVLAASAAAGSAVYKVLFKKVIGNTTFGQISIFFSIVGICNAIMLWPVCIVLYFSGIEYINWESFPWTILLIASALHLAANMLGNFSIAVTYDLFTTLGLITAVPVSAALDVILYGAHFAGMKLAGMILIACGFFLVMFPNNWPEYITRLLQWSRKHRHGISGSASKDMIDYRTGYIKSHLRSPSGRVR